MPAVVCDASILGELKPLTPHVRGKRCTAGNAMAAVQLPLIVLYL